MTTLTPGRWRGLRATSTSESVFAILAFDQRGSYRKMLSLEATYQDAAAIKSEVVGILGAHTSAVLLDSFYGLAPAMNLPSGTGLLMALEESGYTGDSTYRGIEFNDDWTVSKIKAMGAAAVKLLAYYHPHSGSLAEEIEATVRSVVEECHRHDLPLFLEPVSYSLDAAVPKESAAFAASRPQIVRETAERLVKTGADVLKMEFPYDASFNDDEKAWREACEAISAVSNVPWVLLSAGVDFETFERQTRAACLAGASGWLAGRAIWKEGVVLPDGERTTFLHSRAIERVERLTDIAVQHGRPWTDFYTPIPASETWFVDYPQR